MGKNKDIIASTSGTQHNILASGTNMKGDIVSNEDFRIDGSVDGNISCQGKIIIGQSGVVNGNINCSNIEVFGTVEGNITSKENLTLRATSKICGDMKMQTIEIEPGADIDKSSISKID